MGILLMSDKERMRKTVFEAVQGQGLTLKHAAKRLGLSYRQTRRSYQRFKAQGDEGLVHRSRGRPSNRAKDKKFRDKVLKRYEQRYKGFGPTAAAEKLREEGLEIDHETLRRWLLEEKMIERRRKSANHRSCRERKEHFGELVQMDGSIHYWLGADKGYVCLMQLIDDATGIRLCLMAEGETTEVAMRALQLWIEEYGAPQALYTDMKNVYVTKRALTLEEQLAGQEKPLTAFGKACAKLGIEIIPAHSPQAKGRVERSHAVYQDRFVKELALRRITTIAAANKVLLNGFTDEINAKFAVEPASSMDFHLPAPQGMNLEDVFCFEDVRTVQNDWTIQHENCCYQIEEGTHPLPRPKHKVIVRKRLDKSMAVLYRGKPLKVRALTKKQLKARRKAAAGTPAPGKPLAPPKPRQPANSPWRQNCTLMFAETKDKKDGQ